MGTLNEDLTAIKCVEDTLNCNKVARFSYTEEAYRCNCADGVTVYDVDNEQNIPVGNAEIMKVNETVLSKGWRSQASSLTRMLMNHFLGRLSYNVNKLTDNMTGLVNTLVGHVGNANGLATLDANGRIPYSQLPESAIEYKGNWNANTNTPTLSDGMAGATKGDFYIVSVGGTQDLGHGDIQFFANDRIIYDGSIWGRLSAGDVKTVNNVAPVAGNITLTKANIGLGNVDNTADANKTVACAGNATKFAGCTFAQACQAFRSGTLTMSDAGANTTVPVAVCTGVTTVGKSGGLSYGNADGSLYGVSKVVNYGANAQLYCDVGLYGGNCAGKNQLGCNICAYLCGRDGVFHARCGLSSDRVYTGIISNRGAGSDYRDIVLSYGSLTEGYQHSMKLCGCDGLAYIDKLRTDYICSRTLCICHYCSDRWLEGNIKANLVPRPYGGEACISNDCICAYLYYDETGKLMLCSSFKFVGGNTYYSNGFWANWAGLSYKVSACDANNLKCFICDNYSRCHFASSEGAIVLRNHNYLAYTCCDCSDVTCCVKCNLGSGNVCHYVGDASYFANACCFAVYCSTTPAGHSWMGTTICNDTCVDLILDLHGGYCGCYEGCSVNLAKGCHYTFCSCIYCWSDQQGQHNGDACAYVRIDPRCSGDLCNVYFSEMATIVCKC